MESVILLVYLLLLTLFFFAGESDAINSSYFLEHYQYHRQHSTHNYTHDNHPLKQLRLPHSNTNHSIPHGLWSSYNFHDWSHPIRRRLMDEQSIHELNELLFPNKTRKMPLFHDRRMLKRAYTGTVPCVICRGLSTCSILNGFQIEEVYYPKNLNYLETCKVIESLGRRMESLIFGKGRTFRDTVQCRDMVMQYLCLFYGSNNDMYTNYCIYQENVTDPNRANHKVAPRPPCKSFCVQIAGVCANDPDFFIQTCENIACPPTEDECTPDPILNNKVLAANLGCTVPYYSSPYFRSASSKSHHFPYLLYILLPLLVLEFLWDRIKKDD